MREAHFQAAIADRSQPVPQHRFAVYRNNVAAALCHALRVRYPVLASLLGPPAFDDLVRAYSADCLPASPVLIDYGETFPDFIAARGMRGEMPYLADLARLESLWWKAYHAREAEPLAAERFAQKQPENLVFAFHPSAALLESAWKVGTIWEALNQGKGLADIHTDGPQAVLVWRPHAEVMVHVIDPETQAFLAGLMAGRRLAEAAQSVMADFPAFDLTAHLQMLIGSQLITDFSVVSNS